jgi:hypothetical protein
MKGMANFFKQIQKLQNKVLEIQEELQKKEVEASAGGGMVTVRANGASEIISIEIEKEVIESQDGEMIEDLVLAAVNEALKKSKQMVQEEMSKITGGISIPGLNF